MIIEMHSLKGLLGSINYTPVGFFDDLIIQFKQNREVYYGNVRITSNGTN